MYKRPHFKEYVLARLVSMAVLLFFFFLLIAMVWMKDKNSVILFAGLLAFAFVVFIYAIGRGAKRMEKELRIIGTYLNSMDSIEKIDYKTHFFTQELEEINQNLIKILKKSKKREDVKQRYNAKLKLKNRQRADMISAIAHEFRNPIASIMGYSQTLIDDTEIPKTLQEKFLGKIYNNGNKIESLLARLILWNKFESKEATLHKSTFDIVVLTHEVARALQESYPQRTIEVTGQARVIKADRTLIEVVLKNLIENALKYSKDTVSVDVTEDAVLVVDKGVGIGKKDVDKVTKKFYRSGTHSWDNSMGLGLSIVKAILSMHQSTLEIESIKDKGSTFSFKI